MNEFLNLVASGLVTGAIYSIMASGLVLTYTTSGIFNFAHGAIAFAVAYLYYQLHSGYGMPIVPAVIISVFIFAPLLGLLLDRIMLRRLAKAPVYARIVGTIGLVVALPSLVQWLVITVGIKVLGLGGLLDNSAAAQGTRVPGIGPSPPTVYRVLHGVVIDTNQLAVFIAAALAGVVLWYVLRRTRLGLEMRAVVDREALADLRGVNPARASATAWVLTVILAGLGGVLIAPLFTLTDYVFTLVVLGSIAVVVLGGLRSIPIAFAGGLALGVIQNLVAGYSDRILPESLSNLTGLKAAVPFVLVIVLLLAFGRDRSRRAGSVASETVRPDHREGMSALRRRLPWAVGILALVVYSQQWLSVSWFRADTYGQTWIAQGLAISIILLSFVVVTGLGGMVSLAQASFVTIGGFVAGWAMNQNWHIQFPGIAEQGQLNFFWATVLAVIVAGAIGALIAIPITRLGEVNVALGTLAFAFIASLLIFPLDAVSNNTVGWTIRQPTLDLPGLNQVNDLLVVGDHAFFDSSHLSEQILLFLVVFGIVTLVIHALWRSASGRAMLAVRSSEVAAAASGVRVLRMKVMVFALAAAIAGLGGVMLGLFSFQVDNSTAPPLVGLVWLALAVAFGIRRPGGALIAGLVFTGGTALLHGLAGILPGGDVNELVTSTYFVPILSGMLAIQLAQEPDGLLALAGGRQRARRDRKHHLAAVAATEVLAHDGVIPEHEQIHTSPRTSVDADEPSAPEEVERSTFALQRIVAGYGGVEVLHGIDLQLRRGEILALLGANGAGKSTTCAVAAGALSPTSGRVWLDGADVTTVETFRRARSGVLLVPESRGIFPGLTVEENIAVALPDEEKRRKVYASFPVLDERRKQIAGLLSGGEQQMLSLAPALADPPAVLIADEPSLGLAPLIASQLMESIVELRDQGTAVLLVEEHARNALAVADSLAIMELGSVVWSGRRADADMELLASAYLGASRTVRT
jgi:ABC-type branched-subunit amino acid transport system ATPase component/branched-subunit amino acid ABC-type transport system permease component